MFTKVKDDRDITAQNVNHHGTLLFFHTEEFPYTILQDACHTRWCHIAMLLKLSYCTIRNIHARLNMGINAGQGKYNSISIVNHDVKSLPAKYNAQLNGEEYFILESTSEVLECFFTGIRSTGVKLTPMTNRLQYYDGLLGSKRISFDDNVSKHNFDNVVVDIYVALANRCYEKNLFNLLTAWTSWVFSSVALPCVCLGLSNRPLAKNHVNINQYDVLKYNEDDLSSVFCTELIGYVFCNVGVFKSNLNIGALIINNFADLDSYSDWSVKPSYLKDKKECGITVHPKVHLIERSQYVTTLTNSLLFPM